MLEKKEIYKCDICKNVVELLDKRDGTLVCCNQDMELLEEQKMEEGNEKHIPMIEKVDGGYKVVVSSVLHPMEENHYIEWIELLSGKKSYRKFLKPKDEPIAVFNVEETEVFARAYCNVHGLWKS